MVLYRSFRDPTPNKLNKDDHQMKQLKDTQKDPSMEVKQRQPWIKPAIQKIKAGEAEVGTRSTSDGAFTSS